MNMRQGPCPQEACVLLREMWKWPDMQDNHRLGQASDIGAVPAGPVGVGGAPSLEECLCGSFWAPQLSRARASLLKLEIRSGTRGLRAWSSSPSRHLLFPEPRAQPVSGCVGSLHAVCGQQLLLGKHKGKFYSRCHSEGRRAGWPVLHGIRPL